MIDILLFVVVVVVGIVGVNWVVVIGVSGVGGSEFDTSAVSIARSTSQLWAERYWIAVSVDSICVNSWEEKSRNRF